MFHLLILSCQIVIRPELGSLFNCFYGLTIKYWEIRKVGWTFSHLIGSSHTYTIWNNLCQLAIADLSEQKTPCGVLQGSTVFLAFSIQTSLRCPLLTLWNLIASSATLYYHLENIGRIKGFLSKQDTEERVQASFSAGKTIVQRRRPPPLFKNARSTLTPMDSFTPLSNHLSSLANVFTLSSSKEWSFSFRCKWAAELTWGVGPPVLCQLLVERLFCLLIV